MNIVSQGNKVTEELKMLVSEFINYAGDYIAAVKSPKEAEEWYRIVTSAAKDDKELTEIVERLRKQNEY